MSLDKMVLNSEEIKPVAIAIIELSLSEGISLLVIGASLSKPQYSQEWYVRRVHKNLLNENGLPHTVAELCTHITWWKGLW